jgi:hypothetical protein
LIKAVNEMKIIGFEDLLSHLTTITPSFESSVDIRELNFASSLKNQGNCFFPV